jgi:hypothetical protein
MPERTYEIDGLTISLVRDQPRAAERQRFRVDVGGVERGVIAQWPLGDWHAWAVPWAQARWAYGPRESVRGVGDDEACELLARVFATWTRLGHAPTEAEYEGMCRERKLAREDAARRDAEMLEGLRSIQERLAGHLTNLEADAVVRALDRLDKRKPKAAPAKIGAWLK